MILTILTQPPGGRGLTRPPRLARMAGVGGGGFKWIKLHFIHPLPGPLPSRERILLDSFDICYRFYLSNMGHTNLLLK